MQNVSVRPFSAASVLLVSCLAQATSSSAASFVVNTFQDLADETPGDGLCGIQPPNSRRLCSLRAAIQEMNELSSVFGTETIQIPPGTFLLTRAGADEDLGATGDLDVRVPVEIFVADGGRAVIDAQGIDRVFDVDVKPGVGSSDNFRFENLSIRGGDAGTEQGGGLRIIDTGTSFFLDLRYVDIEDNQASEGGGIFAWQPTSISFAYGEIRDNQATSEGGGIWAAGSIEFFNGALVGNTAPVGAALALRGSSTVGDSTLSGNTGGPAVDIDSTVTLRGVTIRAPGATAVRVVQPGVVTLAGSLLVGSCSGDGTVQDDEGNLESPGDTCGLDPFANETGVPGAGLRPLALYGGPTRSHALWPSSPARDLVTGGSCSVDQRLADRGGTPCDAGAFEYGTVSPLPGIFGDGFESGDTAAWN